MKGWTQQGRLFELSLVALGLTVCVGVSTAEVAVSLVPVGNPGNAADTIDVNGVRCGAVANVYHIGKYEVSNTEYVEFLNAADPTGANPYGIYNASMSSDVRGGISYTSGNPNGSKYAVRTNMGPKPVNFVSFWDAARFCNWLNNGQGSANLTTGAYVNVGDQANFARQAGARVFLPTRHEWYKAAYYDPNKGGAGVPGYWMYATKSASTPTIATANATGGISNPGANVVNYWKGADWNGQDGNVTTVGSAGASSASAYGTFDQCGNVWEWGETPDINGTRSLLGGTWDAQGALYLAKSFWGVYAPANEGNNIGFRIAAKADLDFGDAPTTYLTLWANNGACHVVGPGPTLGATIGGDADGQPSSGADGDDSLAGGDDEDGVTFGTTLVRGSNVTVTATVSAQAYLSAWFDWNGNGSWSDSGERAVYGQVLTAAPTLNSVSVSIPAGAVPGPTYARFRVSAAGSVADPFGLIMDGEVEDYRVTVYQPAVPAASLRITSVEPVSASPRQIRVRWSVTNDTFYRVQGCTNLTVVPAWSNVSPLVATGDYTLTGAASDVPTFHRLEAPYIAP